MLIRLRRPQTILLTITVFAVGVFVVMNIMIVQLSSFSSRSKVLIQMDRKRNYQMPISNEIHEQINSREIQKVYLSQNRRKPKTMNEENISDEEYAYAVNRNAEQTVKKNKIIPGISEFNKKNPKMYDHTYYEDGRDNYGNSDENGDKQAHEKDNILQLSSRNLNKHQNEVENIEKLREDEDENIRDIEELTITYDYDDKNDDDYDDDDDDDEDEDEDDNDEYDSNDKNTNQVFKPGDFGDIEGVEFFKKSQLKFEDQNVKVEDGKRRDGDGTAQPELIERGIFWSSYVESLIPKGLSYSNVTKLIRSLHRMAVQRLEPPTWDRCGRPLNGLAILQDGTQVCARNRHPRTSFIYGEVLSFYLSRLLGMDNVPTVVLARIDQASQQWKSTNITKIGWQNNITVALIEWISDLNTPGSSSRSKMPDIILQAYKSGQPVTANTVYKSRLQDRKPANISEIVQWGSMIVFDYITGNYDRVASMQDAAEQEKKPLIIEERIRNLRKSSRTNKLWLIDNESGFFDAYELLTTREKFVKFHKQMLETMCVFQSTLVNAIQKLYKYASPHKRLLNFAKSLEPSLQYMPEDECYVTFVNLFHRRLKDVHDWIGHCESLV